MTVVKAMVEPDQHLSKSKLAFRSKQVLLASMLAMLGACAMINPPSTTHTTTTTSPVPPTSTTKTELPPIDNAETAAPSDNGINRDGRVVTQQRYVERAPRGNQAADAIFEFSAEQRDLRSVIEELGDALGLNMVIDPTIDSKVSVRTSASNPLHYRDIWPVLRMLARNAGVTIEQARDVWKFTRNPSNIPTEIVLPGALKNTTSSEVLQVTPLTYVSVETVEPILTPLLQPAGSVLPMGTANLIGIVGTPEQIERVNALLAVIDDDPFQNQGIHLYQLKNSPAEKVGEELTNVLKLIEGDQSSYHVLGLDRINAVLVIAPANRGFKEVDRWISILDAQSQEQVEQLFVYKVKNLDAPNLAETLTKVFGKKDDKKEGQTSRIELPNGALRPAVPDAFQQAVAENANNADANSGASANISVTIVADKDTNSLLVRATPREYRQLLTTINSLDSVPLQVLINAVIGQVTLTDSNNFGIDWTRVSSNIASGPARLSSLTLPATIFTAATATTPAVAAPGSGLVLTKTFMDGASVINATLNAIAQDNKVRLLSRPTLLAGNNQKGEIKVGSSVPVNNGSTVTTVGTTNNLAYKDVGIQLKITPQINEDGYINMEIFQSLSSQGGTGVGGNPTFVNQEITTTVVVSDQSTITLGGLIQEENDDNKTGVPLLQDIPFLGRAFAYNQLSKTRRELFIILRPQIIYGDKRDDATFQEMRSRFIKVSKLLDEAGL